MARHIALMVLFVVLVVIGGCVSSGSRAEKILTFEECVAVGYPVMESFPAQCMTPEGKRFVSGRDVVKSNAEVFCERDADCLLVNEEYGFRCCWVGACDPVDYAGESWVAVNRAWFEGLREKNCPLVSECGPAPLCAVRAVNEDVVAACVDNACTKVRR